MSFSLSATAVPEQCLQLPERTDACPHLIYKKSPVDVAPLNLKQGEIVCVCLSDFNPLRIAAQGEIRVREQNALLKATARKTGMKEADLLKVIRD